MIDNRKYSTGRTQADIDAYTAGWARFLVDILADEIDKLKVTDTGRLEDSLEYGITGFDTIEHKFLKYGLYVAAGVGKGYRHGNGGDLKFLGDKYRGEHGYGRKQVGAGLSADAMLAPKFDSIIIRNGRNAGARAALTRGKRVREDWFLKKYYYQLQRLNEKQAMMYGEAYQGLVSTFLDALFAKVDAENRIRSNRF